MVFYSALFIIHLLTVRIHFVDTYQIYIIHTHCRMKPITHYILFNLVAWAQFLVWKTLTEKSFRFIKQIVNLMCIWYFSISWLKPVRYIISNSKCGCKRNNIDIAYINNLRKICDVKNKIQLSWDIKRTHSRKSRVIDTFP